MKSKTTHTTVPQKERPPIVHAPSYSNDRLYKRLFYFLLIAMLGILWVAGYNSGVCYDELTLNVYGKDNVAFYASGGKDTSFMDPQFSDMDGAGTFINTVRFYGSVFEYLSIGLNYVLGNTQDGNEYISAHMLNQLLAILAVFFTGLLARKVTGSYRSAFISALLLFLTPIIFGLSIFDTKDIPFMTGYIASLYFTALFLDRLPRPGWKATMGLMLSLFFAFGVRVGAVLLVMYIPLFIFLYGLRSREKTNELLKGVRFWLPHIMVAVLCALALTVLTWPFLLLDPINNFMASINVIRDFPQRIPMVYNGQFTDSLHIPKSYLPHFMLITIPAFIIVAFIASSLLIVLRHRQFKRKLLLLLFFSSFFPILYAVYTNAALYGSWRHFLFVYPGIVIIAAVGIDYSLEHLSRPVYKWAFLFLMIIGMISPITWILRIQAPYQYVYFNEFTGGFSEVFHDYEKDYYMASIKDGMDWLMAKEPIRDSGDTTVVGTNCLAYAHYYIKRCVPGAKVKVVQMGILTRNTVLWDYAVLWNSFLPPALERSYFPPVQTVHTIDVDGMPVCAVLQNVHHYNIKALQAFRKNDFVKSDSLFNLYLKDVHYRPNVPLDLGGLSGSIAYTKVALRKFPAAEALAKNAIIFNSKSYLGYLVLGITNLTKGKLKRAKNNFLIAQRLNAKDIVAKRYLQRIP